MTAEDIAEAIFWSCTLPRNVNINRIQMMPITQAFSPFARSGGPTPVQAVAAAPGCDAGRSYGSGWLRPDEFRSIQTAKQSVISLIVALLVPAILWRRGRPARVC